MYTLSTQLNCSILSNPSHHSFLSNFIKLFSFPGFLGRPNTGEIEFANAKKTWAVLTQDMSEETRWCIYHNNHVSPFIYPFLQSKCIPLLPSTKFNDIMAKLKAAHDARGKGVTPTTLPGKDLEKIVKWVEVKEAILAQDFTKLKVRLPRVELTTSRGTYKRSTGILRSTEFLTLSSYNGSTSCTEGAEETCKK